MHASKFGSQKVIAYVSRKSPHSETQCSLFIHNTPTRTHLGLCRSSFWTPLSPGNSHCAPPSSSSPPPLAFAWRRPFGQKAAQRQRTLGVRCVRSAARRVRAGDRAVGGHPQRLHLRVTNPMLGAFFHHVLGDTTKAAGKGAAIVRCGGALRAGAPHS